MRVQLYITQVCVLYHSQLYAAGGILLSFSVSCGLRLMIEHEYRSEKAEDDTGDVEAGVNLDEEQHSNIVGHTRHDTRLIRTISRDFDLTL